jgi:hypothetical protein
MKSEISRSRRAVLQGTLAWACALMLPSQLSGCDARPKQGAVSTDPGPTPPANDGATPPDDSGKVSQISVQYQAVPKDGKQCRDCLHFIAESGACKMVEGQISLAGWCTIWAAKT